MIVLVIVADSLRHDAPSFSGGAARTPLLDSLAAEGTWFDEVIVSGGSTIPSLMSLLTGCYPHELGVGRWRHPFPAGRTTLLTAFADAGFGVQCFHPYPRFGLLAVPGSGAVRSSQEPDRICEALRRARGKNHLVFVHHWWTHLPYVARALPRDGWHQACDFALDSLRRYPGRVAATLRASYHQAVTHLSEELMGRYVQAATGGGDDLLLMLTGDHGESWGEVLPRNRRVEHIFDLHGRWLADETARVPLLLWGRGRRAVPAQGRQRGLVRGVDLGPTLADLAGVDWPGPAPRGRSLADWVLGGPPAPASEAMTVTSHNTFEPDTYPPHGPTYWRKLGLRDAVGWVTWDGVNRDLRVRSTPGRAPRSETAVEVHRARLEAERLSAVDSGALISLQSCDQLRGAPAQSPDPVSRRLRSWGYLE